MADKNIVVGSLKVDTGSSVADVNAVGKAVTDVKGKLKDTSETVKGVGKDLEGATGNFSKLKDTLTAVPGAAGSAAEGVGKLSDSFKALLANPVVLVITAIVGALALLYKAFTNSFEGGEKMEQIFAGIKAVAQSLLDTLTNLGGALVKLFSGDFKGALDQASKAISDVGDNALKAYNQMAALTKQAQQLARDQADNDLDQVKRQAKLAELRAQAYDDSIPIAKRKAALQDLQKASEENAVEDLALAKKIADNKIAQLTVEVDGEKKNYVEIQKIRADQLKGEVDNANEQRAIGRQLTQIQKQELQERKEAAAKALEDRKKQEENYNAYVTQLEKLRQDAQLQGITDAATKENVALSNRLADQQKAFDLQLKQAKINQDQYDQLTAALADDGHAQRQALEKKRQDQQAKDDADFQNKLNEITGKIQLDGITDQFDKQRLQNQVEYTKSLAEAEKQYAGDAEKLQAYKQAIDKKLAADQEKVDQAQAKDKAKKDYEAALKKSKAVLDDPKATEKDKFDALDADVKATQAAFEAKTLSEEDYNVKIADLAKAREDIRNQELAHQRQIVSAIGDALDTLSDLAGKQTVAGKALAIASTTIKTFQSATSAFAGIVEQIPGPVGIALGVVAAAGAVAAGIANVKKILAVQVPGQGSGGGSTPSAAGSVPAAPVAPTQASTTLDQGSINAVGNAAAGGVNASRVYVLDSDVGNARDRDARLTRQARLGG
jgi:hypothetical protein